MNQALMRTRAGMGDFGLDPNLPYPYPDIYDDGNGGYVGYSPFKLALPGLIAGGLQTVRDIFAPIPATQAAYGSVTPRYVGSGYTDQYGNVIPRTTAVQPGASLTTGGLNLFGSQIGWGTIALVGGLVLLVQMPGFTRRR